MPAIIVKIRAFVIIAVIIKKELKNNFLIDLSLGI